MPEELSGGEVQGRAPDKAIGWVYGQGGMEGVRC